MFRMLKNKNYFSLKFLFVVGFFILLILSLDFKTAFAGINKQLNYQGRINNISGSAVGNGTYYIKLALYDVSSGGTCLWTAVGSCADGNIGTTTVSVVNGIFSIPLGGAGQNSLATSSVDWNSDELYLGVAIRGTAATPVYDDEMTPRKRLTSSVYSFNSDMIDGIHATSTAAVANYLVSLDANKILNLYDGGVSSTYATTTQFIVGDNNNKTFAVNGTTGYINVGTTTLAQSSFSRMAFDRLDNAEYINTIFINQDFSGSGITSTSSAVRVKMNDVGLNYGDIYIGNKITDGVNINYSFLQAWKGSGELVYLLNSIGQYLAGNSTTTGSSYLGTTAGLNGVYINNWSDILSLSGAWNTSTEQYFWNNTSTWSGFASQFAQYYNSTTTLNGFNPSLYFLTANFNTAWANAYNATTTLNGFNPLEYLLISDYITYWNNAFNATSTWHAFDSNWARNYNATSTFGGNLTVNGNVTSTGHSYLGTTAGLSGQYINQWSDLSSYLSFSSGNLFNQWLDTTSTVQFSSATSSRLYVQGTTGDYNDMGIEFTDSVYLSDGAANITFIPRTVASGLGAGLDSNLLVVGGKDATGAGATTTLVVSGSLMTLMDGAVLKTSTFENPLTPGEIFPLVSGISSGDNESLYFKDALGIYDADGDGSAISFVDNSGNRSVIYWNISTSTNEWGQLTFLGGMYLSNGLDVGKNTTSTILGNGWYDTIKVSSGILHKNYVGDKVGIQFSQSANDIPLGRSVLTGNISSIFTNDQSNTYSADLGFFTQNFAASTSPIEAMRLTPTSSNSMLPFYARNNLSVTGNATTSGSSYLGTTAGLNGVYINNWSDLFSLTGAWNTSTEQYFWNNTSTWWAYDTNWARNYNATSTFGGNLKIDGNTTSTGHLAALGGNSDQWNQAFGWGNHALAGYLTTYNETDPIWTGSNLNVHGRLPVLNATTTNTGDLNVYGGITLGGVYRTTWPSAGGSTAGSWWATSTDSLVGYPDLSGDYAIVIGGTSTTTDAKLEVVGNAKIGGNATTTGRLVVSSTDPTNDFGKLWVGGDTFVSGNSTTTGSSYLGTTAGLNGVYINNWSDILSLSGAWNTSTEQYFWNNTSTWSGFASQFAQYYNSTTTLNGFNPSLYFLTANFNTAWANAYNATTTLNGFNPLEYLLISDYITYWNNAFNATSTWHAFDSNWARNYNATSTFGGNLTVNGNVTSTGHSYLGTTAGLNGVYINNWSDITGAYGWATSSEQYFWNNTSTWWAYDSNWARNYNATSTFGGNLTINGNATTTGSHYIGADLSVFGSASLATTTWFNDSSLFLTQDFLVQDSIPLTVNLLSSDNAFNNAVTGVKNTLAIVSYDFTTPGLMMRDTSDGNVYYNDFNTTTPEVAFYAFNGSTVLTDSLLFNFYGRLSVKDDLEVLNTTTLRTLNVTGGVSEDLSPLYDKTYSLGTTTKRWENVWTDSVNVSGSSLFNNLTVTSTLNFFGPMEKVATNLSLPQPVRNLYVADNYVYIATYGTNGWDSFRIVDISNPTQPKIVGGQNLSDLPKAPAKRVWAQGNYAYIVYRTDTSTDALRIVDISDKANPFIVGGQNLELTDWQASDGQPFYVTGKYAYIMSNENLYIVDISNPYYPRLIKVLTDVSHTAWDIKVIGDYAYVCHREEVGGIMTPLSIVNVKDKNNPTIISKLSIPGLGQGCWSVDVAGAYAYLGLGTIGGTSTSTDLFRIVDISNPASPQVVGGVNIGAGNFALTEENNAFNFVKVLGNYLYATTWQDGFLTIDVSSSTNPQIMAMQEIGEGIVTQNFGPLTFDFKGRYVSVGYAPIGISATSTGYFRMFKSPGMDAIGANIDALGVGSLQVLNNSVFNQRVSIWDGLEVGTGGLYTQGSLSVMSTSSPSYFGGYLGIGTTTPNYKLVVNASNTTDNLLQVATTTNQGIFEIRNDGIARFGYDLVVNGTATSTFAGNVQIAQGKNLQVENIFAYSPLNINTDLKIFGNATATGNLVATGEIKASNLTLGGVTITQWSDIASLSGNWATSSEQYFWNNTSTWAGFGSNWNNYFNSTTTWHAFDSNWARNYNATSTFGGNLTINGNATTTGHLAALGGNSDQWNSAYTELNNFFSTTKEQTGFPNQTDTSISFNSTNGYFTITGTNFKVYSAGKEYTKNTESIEINTTTPGQLHFVYYDKTTKAISTDTTSWNLTDGTIQLATVFWNGTEGVVGEERHGLTMDGKTHEYLHLTVGTRYNSGLTGTFNTNNTFSISNGSIYDEDILNSIAATSTARILYRTAPTTFTFTSPSTSFFDKTCTGSNLCYDNNGTKTAAGANNYVAYWVFATNDPNTGIYVLMGQREDTNLANAQTNAVYSNLSLSNLPFSEMKLLYRVIVRNVGGNTLNTTDYRSVSNLPSGTYVATAHNILTGLDYTNAGHTGFAGTGVENIFTQPQSFQTTINATSTNVDNLLVFAGATTTSLYTSNQLSVATSSPWSDTKLAVGGNAAIGGNLTVTGSQTLSGNLLVSGNATTTGSLHTSEICVGNDCISDWSELASFLSVSSGNPFNQWLDSTSSVAFATTTLAGQLTVNATNTRNVAAHCSVADYEDQGACEGNGETWYPAADHEFVTSAQTDYLGYLSALSRDFMAGIFGYATSSDETGGISSLGVYGQASDVGVAGVSEGVGGYFQGQNMSIFAVGTSLFVGDATFNANNFSVGTSTNSLLAITDHSVGLGQYSAPSEFFGVQPSSNAGQVATARFKTWDNVDQLFLDASGNVGINTTTPGGTYGEKFTLVGNSYNQGNATTTGSFYVGSQMSVGTTSPWSDKVLAVSGGAAFSSLGPEKVTNGSFTGNADGWTLESALWTYSTNNVRRSGSGANNSLSQDTGEVAGEAYLVTFTISTYTSGSVTPAIGGTPGTPVSANGTYQQTIVAKNTNNLTFYTPSSASFYIDDVSVKKVLGDVSSNSYFNAAAEYRINNLAVLSAPGQSNINLGRYAGNSLSVYEDGVFLPATSTIAIGDYSLYSNTYGYRNIAVGSRAMYANTTGFQNIAIGTNALALNQTTDYNIAIGGDALAAKTGGDASIAIGFESLTKLTTGVGNTALGHQTLAAISTGNYSTAFGYKALNLATGSSNSAFGYQTLDSLTSGSYNVAVGSGALGTMGTADYGTAVGHNALASNTAANSSAFGGLALFNNSTGQDNSAFGYRSLYYNETGRDNIAFGRDAGFRIMGSYNVSLGNYSMGSAVSKTASGTVAIGFRALEDLTSGDHNVAIGYYAGQANTTGQHNIYIGSWAGTNLAAALGIQNSIAIGYQAKVDNSNAMVLGGTGANSISVGINTTTPGTWFGEKLTVVGNSYFQGNATTTGSLYVNELNIGGYATSTFNSNLAIAQGKNLQVENIFAYSPLNVNAELKVFGNSTTTGKLTVTDVATLATTTMSYGSKIGDMSTSSYMMLTTTNLNNPIVEDIPVISFFNTSDIIGKHVGAINKSLIVLEDLYGTGSEDPDEGDLPSIVLASKDISALSLATIYLSTTTGELNFRDATQYNFLNADIYANSVLLTGADYAEYFFTNDKDLVSGEAVCLDITKSNTVARCQREADTNIIGIVSSKPAITGNNKKEYVNNPNYKIIGLLGQVPAKVSLENGEIRIGDSLTAASVPGYLMKASAGDSTVGVALESLSDQTGTINVLISRRNKSLTVEEIESQITDRIANMEIEDEVNLLINSAIEGLNLDQEILDAINPQLALLETKFDLKLDLLTGSIEGNSLNIKNLQGAVDNLDLSLTAAKNAIKTFEEFASSTQSTLADLNSNIMNLQSQDLEMIQNWQSATSAISYLTSEIENINQTLLEKANEESKLEVSQTDLAINNLSVSESATFYGTILVKGEAGFEHKVTFYEDIVVKGKIYASKDQAGTVVLLANQTSVDVVFGKEYLSAPKVVANLSDDDETIFVNFKVVRKTTKGFTIILQEPVEKDITFDWIALAIQSQPPTIQEIVPSVEVVPSDSTVDFQAQVIDSDTLENDLKYSWEIVSGPGVLIGTTNRAIWSLDNQTLEADADLEIKLTVTDESNVVSQTKTIKVKYMAPEVTPETEVIPETEVAPTPEGESKPLTVSEPTPEAEVPLQVNTNEPTENPQPQPTE